MFYRLFRALTSLLLRQFFNLERPIDPTFALNTKGPVIFVGNHPNGLIDPGLIFILTSRQVTFLAKQPLFDLPVLGLILRGLGALPVFRKQDGASTAANDSTLNAAVDALKAGRAITLFPEGKSHSEPQLTALKTGCARIALEACRAGANVKIVPIGMTYAEKNRYRSRVHFEVGAALDVARYTEAPGEEAFGVAKRLTQDLADALREVTVNLSKWEDLPLIETAEALYTLKESEPTTSAAPERRRAFARGLALLRVEQPERLETLKQQLAAYRQRLELVAVTPRELTFEYRPATVARFAARNALWLVGLPIFALGMVVFVLPYWVPAIVSAATKSEEDTQSTVKVLTTLVLAPLWWALVTVLAFEVFGLALGVAALLLVPPLALFTRWYFERRVGAVRDARVFFAFANRSKLKARLLAEGEALAADIEALARELTAAQH